MVHILYTQLFQKQYQQQQQPVQFFKQSPFYILNLTDITTFKLGLFFFLRLLNVIRQEK